MVQPSTFTVDSNRVIWKCIEHIFREGTNQYIDVPTILSAAQDIGLKHHFDRAEEAKHLSGVLSMPVKLDNVRRFAGKCRKLEIARLIREQLGEAQDDLLEITGDENIISIVSMAEVDFSSLMQGEDGSPRKLGEGIRSHLEHLADNPVEQIGISTGFPAFDESIGGGLRDATINVIAARPKTGKTLLSDNMGYNIARQNIPVLNLDTEMTEEDHFYRTAAMISGIPINDIESGKFGRTPADKERIWEACAALENVPYFYRSIAGKPFEDQLSLIRRWLVKDVGLEADGTAKPCVVIYDYLKLMDSQGISQEMKEYQLLGFMMTSLHNFAHRYRVPILAFMPL
jgi:replicative DNA helicase